MQKTTRGFTLVELLIVIAIIVTLAAAVVLIINPLELNRKDRDASRLSDLASLHQAINVASETTTVVGPEIFCTPPATAPCSGNSNDSGGSVSDTDGKGWVKVDLSVQKNVPMPLLPVDPLNNATHFYRYSSDGSSWEIDAVLESQQQNSKMQSDGGNNDNRYEIGSNQQLLN